MNTNITNIKNTIADLAEQIKEAKNKLSQCFDAELKTLFKSHKTTIDGFTLDRIEIHINNHEFNDGDATNFSVDFDYLTLIFSDELGNEKTVDYEEENPNFEKVRKEFSKFFGIFDVENFYETKFGDMYDTLTITCNKTIEFDN